MDMGCPIPPEAPNTATFAAAFFATDAIPLFFQLRKKEGEEDDDDKTVRRTNADADGVKERQVVVVNSME